MILDIDAGNTRIKWRLTDGPSSGTAISGSVLAKGNNTDILGELANELQGVSQQDFSRIRVSNVRGEEFRQEFIVLAEGKWQLHAEFASVSKQCSGVTNAYDEIGTMGVDRWLAMLAAWNRASTACCVLDCGSAITLDWIDREGMHQGGYIVPGLQLLQESLARKAPALDIPPGEWGTAEPGTTTRSAINNGIIAMVTGFAEHCRQVMETSGKEKKGGREVQWFLTGGDAGIVAENLSWPHQVEKDLVLEGLAFAIPD